MYQFFSSDLFGVSADTANWVANGIVALVAVFFAILLYKMFTRPRMAGGRRSKNARLAITDAASIDDRRRLVLVRRDDVEHLIMIGGATDMVIESDIERVSVARPAAPAPMAAASTTVPKSVPLTVPAAPAAPATPTPASPPASPIAAVAPAASAAPTAPRTPALAPKPANPDSANVATLTPNKPAAASNGSISAAKPAAAPSILAAAPSSAVRPASAASGSSDASSLIGDVRAKPAQPTQPTQPARKASVGDNLDALLTEITAKK